MKTNLKVRDILGLPPDPPAAVDTPLLCLPKCKVGMEYEWENVQNFSFLGTDALGTEFRNYFTCHADGSLRGSSAEYVFRKPFMGSHVINAIDVMDQVAKAKGFQGSYRTSLHVHLDMLDTEFPETVERLGAVYCLVEPALYDFIGDERSLCNYCVPWYIHPQHIEQYFRSMSVFKMFPEAPTKVARSLKEAKQYKYAGLNFFSLGDYGTIEFRHASVDMPKNKIVKWVNLLMRLKKWAVTHTLSVRDIIEEAQKKGPFDFTKEVFEEDYADIMPGLDPYGNFKLGLATLYLFASYTK